MTLPNPQDSQVVLIGVSEYTHLPNLPAVANNIEALRQIFTSRISWDLASENCTVVHNPRTPEEFVDPILHGVENATDTLLVYYAGHGLKGPNRGEFRLSRTTSRGIAPHTSVDYNDIRETLLSSSALRRIVILDCCFAASALGVMSDPASNIADDALVEGTYLIAAAGDSESAVAEDGRGFTVFTGELVRLFRDSVSAAPHGLLDLDTAFDHLFKMLYAKALPTPHRRVRNSLGKLVLARNTFLHECPGSSTQAVDANSPSDEIFDFGAYSTAVDRDQMQGCTLDDALHRRDSYTSAPQMGLPPGVATWPRVATIGRDLTSATSPAESQGVSLANSSSIPANISSFRPLAQRPGATPKEEAPTLFTPRELQLMWYGILDATKKRRRFAWIHLQKAEIKSFEENVLTISFKDEYEKSTYLSSGVEQTLALVIREDCGLPWKIRVSGAPPCHGSEKGEARPGSDRRPGEWPVISTYDHKTALPKKEGNA
ncbi:caspase, EACC1-associated type [Streptomyces sp. NPDC004673]